MHSIRRILIGGHPAQKNIIELYRFSTCRPCHPIKQANLPSQCAVIRSFPPPTERSSPYRSTSHSQSGSVRKVETGSSIEYRKTRFTGKVNSVRSRLQ